MLNAMCLHGWGYKREVFTPLSLIEHFNDVKTPCLYEAGDNTPDYCLSKIAEQLARQVKQDTVLFGWSLGGLVALNMLDKTEKIKALVLIATAPVFVNKTDWHLSIDKKEFSELRSLLMAKPERAIKQFNLLSTMGELNTKETARKTKGLTTDTKHQSILEAWLLELYDADYRDILNNLTTPTLMFFGQQDALLKPDITNEIKNRFIETQVLKDCSHLPFINHSKEMLSIVNRFLKQYGK